MFIDGKATTIIRHASCSLAGFFVGTAVGKNGAPFIACMALAVLLGTLTGYSYWVTFHETRS